MPRRPREHQVEQRSINAFERVLPDQWQPRPKSNDYGVDREVELFALDGNSTGLVFNVQLKGTDDEAKAQSASIGTDNIQYLCSLDVPAIIVRHCGPKDTLYWMWAFEALGQIRSGAESVTLNFADDRLWTSATAETIERTLKTIRQVKSRDRRSRFKLVIADKLSGPTAIGVQRVKRVVENRTPYGVFEASHVAIPVSIDVIEGQIALTIEGLGTLSTHTNTAGDEDRIAAAMYGLSVALASHGFDAQAECVAAACKDYEVAAPSRELAAAGAAALIAKPMDAIALAMANGLHTEQDFAFSMFLTTLIGPRNASADSNAAITQFFEAAIAAHQERGQSAGNLCYNLANRLRSMRRYREAIGAYNRARKSDAGYMARAYFSKEIGGVLFNLKRFSCSAKAYRRSEIISGDIETKFLFADALMFAGNYLEAAQEFDLASASEGVLGAESRLRGHVAKWLGSGHNVPDSISYHDLMAFREKCVLEKDFRSLFLAQLTLTLCEFNGDHECWGETIFFSILADIGALRDVMICASSQCGLEAYQFCKERQLPNLKIQDEEIQIFDRLSLEIQDEVDAEKEASGPDFTLRMN